MDHAGPPGSEEDDIDTEAKDLAFNAFVVARSTALLRSAYLLTGDRSSAEDLLQTALAKSYVAWSRITAEPGPEAYVRRVMVTTNISWWRASRHLLLRHLADHELESALGPSPTPQVEDRLALWSAIRALPMRQRTVVVLRYYEDLTEAQTAALMGCSVGTVKKYHARALAALRLRMSPPVVRQGDNRG